MQTLQLTLGLVADCDRLVAGCSHVCCGPTPKRRPATRPVASAQRAVCAVLQATLAPQARSLQVQRVSNAAIGHAFRAQRDLRSCGGWGARHTRGSASTHLLTAVQPLAADLLKAPELCAAVRIIRSLVRNLRFACGFSPLLSPREGLTSRITKVLVLQRC